MNDIGTNIARLPIVGTSTLELFVLHPMKGVIMLTTEQAKKIGVTALALPLLAMLFLTSTPTLTQAQGENVEATYKAKCAMCHGVKAEKSFDAAKSDEVLAESVLKGIKPKMPSYDQKIASDQVKALVAYMKSLHK